VSSQTLDFTAAELTFAAQPLYINNSLDFTAAEVTWEVQAFSFLSPGEAAGADIGITLQNLATTASTNAFSVVDVAIPWAGADPDHVDWMCLLSDQQDLRCIIGADWCPGYKICTIIGPVLTPGQFITGQVQDRRWPSAAPEISGTGQGLSELVAAAAVPRVHFGSEYVDLGDVMKLEEGTEGRQVWRGWKRFRGSSTQVNPDLGVEMRLTFHAGTVAALVNTVELEVRLIFSGRTKNNFRLTFGSTDDIKLSVPSTHAVHVDYLQMFGGKVEPISGGRYWVTLFDADETIKTEKPLGHVVQGQPIGAWKGAIFDLGTPYQEEWLAYQARAEFPIRGLPQPDAVVTTLPLAVRPPLHPSKTSQAQRDEAWLYFLQDIVAGYGRRPLYVRKGSANPPWLGHNQHAGAGGFGPDFGCGMVSPFFAPDYSNPAAVEMFWPAMLWELQRPGTHRHDDSLYEGTLGDIGPFPATRDGDIMTYADMSSSTLFMWAERPYPLSHGRVLLFQDAAGTLRTAERELLPASQN
jgi:hypothetical protein